MYNLVQESKLGDELGAMELMELLSLLIIN